MSGKITYYVTDFLPQRKGDKHPPKIVEERLDGFAVNRYTAYDYDSYLALYPMKGGRLIPSNVPYEPKKIKVIETRRAY
jgi:hypothetical protein